MQSVLITGASSGIGAASAARLARKGFRVVGTSRKPEQVGPDGSGIHWLALDVCEPRSVEAAVVAARAAVGELDALVCNAGYGIFGSVEEVSIEAAQAQLDTNLLGVLRVLRSVLPGMREAKSGRVVIVGSLAASFPIPFQAHYSASKAALAALALALRNEVRAHGIQVSLVEPGDVATPFNDAMDWGDAAASAYGEAIARCREAIVELLPRAPGPESVARVIERALAAQRPRARYTAGADATLGPLARRLLPDWINLAVLRSRYRL